MKPSILALAVASSLVMMGCSQPDSNNTQSVASGAAQAEQTSQVTEAAKPELGSFGIDLDARNTNIKPGDDFFMYASGTWYDNFEMPADKTSYGAFAVLADRSEERVQGIIENVNSVENKTLEESLIANYYSAFMDVDSANEKGISPIQPMLDDIANIEDTAGLTKAFGNAWMTGTNTPIAGGLGFNRLDPNEYQLSIGVSGLGLPDRSYYLEDNEANKEVSDMAVQTLT